VLQRIYRARAEAHGPDRSRRWLDACLSRIDRRSQGSLTDRFQNELIYELGIDSVNIGLHHTDFRPPPVSFVTRIKRDPMGWVVTGEHSQEKGQEVCDRHL